MVSFCSKGQHGPELFFLHWLGGGAQTWNEVSSQLARRGVRCTAIDLPGFGESADVAGYSIAAMTAEVVETLHCLREGTEAGSRPWLIAGHSMGGSVAAAVARRALDGEPGLGALKGIVLVSPSPPGPEPMEESKKASMLKSLGEATGNAEEDRKAAVQFIDENTGKLALPDEVRERTIQGVLAMNRTAFRSWLEHGSKEDWRDRIGTLPVSALVFAGSEDGALGPAAQQKYTLPHLPCAELITLEGTGHLAPLERPAELVEHITSFLTSLNLPLCVANAEAGAVTEELMRSGQTSPRTADAMKQRLARSQNWNHVPRVFSSEDFYALRALAEAVVPHAGFDLAACIDQQLERKEGDGWRYSVLPPDPDAWRQGILSLNLAARRAHGVSFLALFPTQAAYLLHAAAQGKVAQGVLGSLNLGESRRAYTAPAMQRWFEEVRAEFARLYMGDPRTMHRIGYTGFADEFGFTRIQLGQQEALER